MSHLELDWAVSAVRAFHLALATGRTLVRYDRPGCGLSEPYEGSRSIELEVAAIRAAGAPVARPATAASVTRPDGQPRRPAAAPPPLPSATNKEATR